jgi:EAL domain-containing protein (putative c-di-GMP-specific phosphodiesterase class I)
MKAYLEHFPEQGGPAERVEIIKDPFVIGRSQSADLAIYSRKVSKDHALITQLDASYIVRDLSSTNGTFVNGKRIDEAPLYDGDIIHFAHLEFGFCAGLHTGRRSFHTASVTQATEMREKESLIRLSNFLREMMLYESVSVEFQSIVDLRTRAVVGFEALGRGRHHQLHHSPIKLFQLAERCQMARELCCLFRNHALKIGEGLPAGFRLFINIHPSVMMHPNFLQILEELAARNRGQRQLVIEVSEQSVTDLAHLRLIRSRLEDLGIEFAYDDFGAAQARLLELAECPPHYLKLDRALVQGTETSETSRQLVRALLSAISETSIKVIAEGIESERTADLCVQYGCHFGQGFLYGRPGSLLDLSPVFAAAPWTNEPG